MALAAVNQIVLTFLGGSALLVQDSHHQVKSSFHVAQYGSSSLYSIGWVCLLLRPPEYPFFSHVLTDASVFHFVSPHHPAIGFVGNTSVQIHGVLAFCAVGFYFIEGGRREARFVHLRTILTYL